MAFDFGFYNSRSEDRVYDAIQMSKIFDGIIADGVYATLGEAMIVTADTGMDILVGTGRAWFNHTWNYVDSRLRLTVEESSPILSRIDAVVLDVDERVENRINEIKIVAGTPATVPAKPTLINEDEHHQHPLAWITVDPDVTSIVQSKIENAVGTSACPFVTGIIDTIDVDQLLLQYGAAMAEYLEQYKADAEAWEDQFEADQAAWETLAQGQFSAWFENMRGQLTEDAAGHLQDQIDRISYVYVQDNILYLPATLASVSDGVLTISTTEVEP